jgi:galactokinase
MTAFRAPGRVNLIGGQVDYHEGLVVSMAIDRDVTVEAAARDDALITASSRYFEGTVEIAANGDDDPARIEPAWGRLVAGVACVLAEAGRPATGADLAITSNVPIGAGLSSSAAFEVACALALCDAAGFAIEARTLTLAAQRAEHIATGVPCGIQDQTASVYGRADHAIFLDCRSLAVEHVPLPSELRVLVVHCGVARHLEATPYAQRRAESEQVAAQLGLRVLRDATLEQVCDLPRGRHVVTEIQRVRAFADALRTGDLDALGPLMLASHASSRDYMQVSIPELDTLVECLVGAGAHGARLTGAGFGGCVVALVDTSAAAAVAERATADYRARTGRDPSAWIMRAANGAGPVNVS